MSDIHMVLNDKNEPIIAFADEADAKRYIEIQAQGSVLMPARNDLRVFSISVWRNFDKLRAAMQKIDASWGAGEATE